MQNLSWTKNVSDGFCFIGWIALFWSAISLFAHQYEAIPVFGMNISILGLSLLALFFYGVGLGIAGVKKTSRSEPVCRCEYHSCICGSQKTGSDEANGAFLSQDQFAAELQRII